MDILWVYKCEQCNETPNKCQCPEEPTKYPSNIEDLDPEEIPF